MKNSNETRDVFFGFAKIPKHVEKCIGDRSEKVIESASVETEEITKFCRDSKSDMSVRGIDDLFRHSLSTLAIVKIPT